MELRILFHEFTGMRPETSIMMALGPFSMCAIFSAPSHMITSAKTENW